MRRVIRKYDDFVKSKLVSEDIEPMVTPEMVENEGDEGFESTEDTEDIDSANLIDSEEDVAPEMSEGEEEEESGEYEGTRKLNQLAEMLGTKVVDNHIEYDGKVINFYSEDEKFHIVGYKKFKSDKVEEVVEFLKNMEEEPVVENKRFERRKK